MKDSKINNTIGLAIKIGAILIIIGAAWQTLKSNEKRIDLVETKAHTNEISIVELKGDVKYIRVGIDEIKREVKKD